MKYQKIQLFSQGIIIEHKLPEDIVEKALAKFTRQGYTCWKVETNEKD